MLCAQTPVFRPCETRELGNVHITALLQDAGGWMWMGAADRLLRYDGLGFQSVILPDSMRQDVSALFEWDGRIWVGFRDGGIGFVPIDKTHAVASGRGPASATRLEMWGPEEGTPQKTITAFAADPSGAFWIATYGEGIYCLKNNRLYQFSAADDGLESDEIYALACDGLGRVWAATDAGVKICSMDGQGQKSVVSIGLREGLPDEIATALLADPNGNIWVGTHENGICHYDVKQQRFDYCSTGWSFGTIHSFAAFGTRDLWVSTKQNGLIRLDLPTGTIQALPDGHPLRHAGIPVLRKDREGLLWVLDSRGGVYSANVRFGLLATPFDNSLSILADRRHRIWAGNPEGLFLIDDNKRKKITLPGTGRGPLHVIALWESVADGNIWAGTFNNGVYVISPEGRLLRHLTTRDGLQDNNVLSVAGDERQVWLATFGGVTAVDLKTQTCTRLDEPGNGYVYKVFRDSKGRIWFGTDGKGLILLENKQFRSFAEAAGITLKTIYSIAEDRRGQIWFCTDKDGLFRYDGQQFFRYDTKNHLHSLAFTGLAAGSDGQIVITYEDGIDLLNPDRPDHVTFCDATIGAPPAEVNLNALCRDAFGNVWVGARQGILRIAAFDEAFMDDPQPGITSVVLYSKAIDFPPDAVFRHDENYFIFNFTGLWFTNPEAVRYRYRLDGVDLDWKVSKDHLASYPGLRPGRYTFRVQTSEHGNFERVPETTWSFVIESPVWTRWWFVLLCLMLAGGLIYSFIKWRETRLEKEARLKREKVESQFEALKSQINPHFLFNSFNTLITIIEENPKVAVEYVEHLSDFYRSIIAYRERDFISLQEEMDLVHSFHFLLKKRYEDGFHLVDRLNGQTGFIMPLALQLLIENAVKHNVISATRPLTVEIFSENGEYVVVRNNIQPKIKPEPSTRFGLQSLVNRYHLLGERPVVVEDNAAFFTVKIPIHSDTARHSRH